MRFNLGRRLLGWRKFAGEVGIIVLGVLLALGAQEIVDDWNWDRAIKAQRMALDEDVVGMWGAMSARAVIQKCMDRRLQELDLVFQRQRAGRPIGLVAPIGRPAVWTAGQSALKMATADGSLAHMPLADKRRYFAVAGAYDIFAPAAREERDSWRILQRLDVAEQLDAVDWRELRNAYRDAVDANRALKFNLTSRPAEGWLEAFASFPKMPTNADTLSIPYVHDLCQPALRP